MEMYLSYYFRSRFIFIENYMIERYISSRSCHFVSIFLFCGKRIRGTEFDIINSKPPNLLLPEKKVHFNEMEISHTQLMFATALTWDESDGLSAGTMPISARKPTKIGPNLTFSYWLEPDRLWLICLINNQAGLTQASTLTPMLFSHPYSFSPNVRNESAVDM